MKDTVKFEFSGDEASLIIKSLSTLRNKLLEEDRDVGVIDDILIKYSEGLKVELDRYEVNIMINSLNELRNVLKSNDESPMEVNNLILKLINENGKKKNTFKSYEER